MHFYLTDNATFILRKFDSAGYFRIKYSSSSQSRLPPGLTIKKFYVLPAKGICVFCLVLRRDMFCFSIQRYWQVLKCGAWGRLRRFLGLIVWQATADNPTPFMCRLSRNSGSFNLLEASQPPFIFSHVTKIQLTDNLNPANPTFW